jgi:Mn2+/Fe2+ NRAMP family transporter
MSSQTTDARQIAQEERPRWKLAGPGLVVAATGVGAADLVATLVAGSRYGYTLLSAELLYSAQIAVSSGDEGVVDLAQVLQDRYGTAAGTVLLVGFGAAAMSSLVGVWNSVSLMFAGFMAHARGLDATHPDARSGGRCSTVTACRTAGATAFTPMLRWD